MKKHLAVITICTLALANAVPAMPVYAASKTRGCLFRKAETGGTEKNQGRGFQDKIRI